MNELATPLAERLRSAVRGLDFAATADAQQGGRAVGLHPSIDLAVVQFVHRGAPRWANVLFSREHPDGLAADIGTDAGAVRNIRYDADQRDARGESIAWQPGTDWSTLHWRALVPSPGARVRFVAPYPASLLKLMVAVGVALAVESGQADWPAALEPMITRSDNEATDACVALLHRSGSLQRLHERLAAMGLHTLQLNDTTPAGGWRNADGAGVGHIHMTAWDTVRLLWLLDEQAPPPPWLPAGASLLQPASRRQLRGLLEHQQHDSILSSGSLRGLPGWVPGLPDAPAFAHKTGNSDNYASDAGIVDTPRCHYLVALLSSLGRRYAPPDAQDRCDTTWRVPALGAAVHALMEPPP